MLPAEVWTYHIFNQLVSKPLEPVSTDEKFNHDLRIVQIYRELFHLKLVSKDFYGMMTTLRDRINALQLDASTCQNIEKWQATALEVYFFKLHTSRCPKDVILKIFELIPFNETTIYPNPSNYSNTLTWAKILVYIYKQFQPTVLNPYKQNLIIYICNAIVLLADMRPKDDSTEFFESLLQLYLKLDTNAPGSLYKKEKTNILCYYYNALGKEDEFDYFKAKKYPLWLLSSHKIRNTTLKIMIDYGLDVNREIVGISLLKEYLKAYCSRYTEAEYKSEILQNMQLLLQNGANVSKGMHSKLKKLKPKESSACITSLFKVFAPFLVATNNKLKKV